MNSAQLTVHVGGVKRTRDELRGLHTPEATATWRPVPHADLVDELVRGLEAKGVTVARDEYATMGRDHSRLFGVMDLRIPTFSDPDFGMALGLRGSNDKSLAIGVIAAARVFVCDNLAFSGSAGSVCLNRKHTSGLDLSLEVPAAVDAFMEKAGVFRLDLGAMRGVGITDGTAKGLIHDAFASGTSIPHPLPLRLFHDVSRLYFRDEEQLAMFPDRTLWSLNNAFTGALKVLRPGLSHQAGISVGRFFARTLRDMIGSPAELN